MKKTGVLLLLLLLSFTFPVSAKLKLSKAEQEMMTDWQKSVIKAEGVGFAQGEGARARSLAKIAAVTQAQAKLVETIAGVNITSEVTVKEQMLKSQVIKKKVKGKIRGARVIEEEPIAENGYRVIMELKFYGKNGIVKTIFPKLESEVKNNKLAGAGSEFGVKAAKAEQSKESISDYTGVIIDADDLKVQAALFPKIYAANGKLIYALSKLNYQGVATEGIVAYRPSLADAKSDKRIGRQPLIIDAQQVQGEFNSDLVITNQDAKLMNQVGYQNNIFKDRKVIVVK